MTDSVRAVPSLPLASSDSASASRSSRSAAFPLLLSSMLSIPARAADDSSSPRSPLLAGAGNPSVAPGMDSLGLMLVLQLVEQLIQSGGAQETSVPANGAFPVAGTLTQDFQPGHTGIDLAVAEGTPVQSTQTGQVSFAGWNEEGYGYLVVVENGPVRTYYAHLKEMPRVSAGQWIGAGQVLGYSGSTGNSTGPHVHYEVRVNGNPVSPLAGLNR